MAVRTAACAATAISLAKRTSYPLPFLSMRFLSLAALKLAFDDLATKRHAALVHSSAGKTYQPILLEKKALIDALPAALTGGKPLAEEIADADVVHDGFGAAIWHFSQAYERWPEVPSDVLAAIKRIQAALITSLDDLQASYATEAHAAARHRENLQTLESDLKMIPVAGGLSLYDWAVGFIGGGDLVGTLLSQRADANTHTRTDAGKIRAGSVAVLGRFRGALQDEIAQNLALPRDLDAQVFAYFDELSAMRGAALAARPKKKAAVPAAIPPAAPATPGTVP